MREILSGLIAVILLTLIIQAASNEGLCITIDKDGVTQKHCLKIGE